MRRASSVDANQPRIVACFRKLGCTVQPLHAVGQGVLDLLVGYRGVTHIVEVKDGAKSPSKRKLTPDQQEWWEAWCGDKSLVENEDQVIRLVARWLYESTNQPE